ncbi:MAG: AAA family ATPase [Carboxydocellales bacterium]
MILEYLKVENFRQYFGNRTIYFSKSKDKNVTVIHGENGSGKTAFLNTFNWCFYGKVNLPNPEVIINERAEAEAQEGKDLQASVEVRFRDNNRDYTILRTILGKKSNGKFNKNSDNLHVSYIDEKGKTEIPKNAQDTIDQIMPESMKSYFFFDGESIDNLSKKEGSKEIKKAIKNIMGLEVLERSVNHLDQVRKVFLGELEASGSREVKDLIAQRNKIESDKAYNNKMLDELYRNRGALKTEKELVENRLRNMEGAKELQDERDRLEKFKGKVRNDIQEKETEIKTLCSKRGFLAFALGAINKTKEFLEAKREKGEIPAGIKKQFVEDLLEKGWCICGTELVHESEHFNKVSAWLNKAGSKELEDHFAQTSANVKLLASFREGLFKELKKLKGEKEKFLLQLKEVNEQLDEISVRLDGKDSEEIKSLERKRRDLDSALRDQYRSEGEYHERIKTLDEQIARMEREIEKCKLEEDKAALANRRVSACKDAKEMINAIHESLAVKVKEKLQHKINDVYGNFLRKGYTAKLNDNYELQIMKEFGDDERSVAMSQGERQITSLSFIGALVDIAREQYERGGANFFRGGIYPIVMDSPFGALDPDHRSRIAEGVPRLAHQVIVLVTDSQWNNEVEQKISTRMGKEYFLNNYSPKKDKGVKYEYTEIVEG